MTNEEQRALVREAYELTQRVKIKGETYKGDPAFDRVRTKLNDSYDLAVLLGGETLQSWIVCAERIADSYVIVGTDSCPFSFTFEGHGMYGGLIFHSSDRTWSMHT